MSKCVKYWLKLIQMPVNRYPHVCYNMSRSYDDSGTITWATHVKMLLHKYGFGHVRLLQGVGDETMFFLNFHTETLRQFCSGLAPRYNC